MSETVKKTRNLVGELLDQQMVERNGRGWKLSKKAREKIERLKLPNKEKLWGKVLKKYRKGWKCSYCGQELKIKDGKWSYFSSFSIDHKKSIGLGGTNDLENLTICCHRCNIVKSTMKAKTFKKMLKCSEPLINNDNLLDQMFYEQFKSKMANKLDREDAR